MDGETFKPDAKTIFRIRSVLGPGWFMSYFIVPFLSSSKNVFVVLEAKKTRVFG